MTKKRQRPPSCTFFSGNNTKKVKERLNYAIDLTEESDLAKFSSLYTELKREAIKSIALTGDIQGNHNVSVLTAIKLAGEHIVEEIDLNTTLIGDKGINLLKNILKNNRSQLKKLKLSFTELTNQQAIALSEGLSENRMLTELNLSSNDITTEGMIALNVALEKNNTLKILDLSYNPDLGDDGIKEFCPTLQNNKTLTVLNLRQCNISDAGLESIIQALENNKSINKLDIRDNEISENGASFVSAFLENNKSIQINLFEHEFSSAKP